MNINKELFKQKNKNKYRKYYNLEGGLFCDHHLRRIKNLESSIERKKRTLKKKKILNMKLNNWIIELERRESNSSSPLNQQGGLFCYKQKENINILRNKENELENEINEYDQRISNLRVRIEELNNKLMPESIPITINSIPTENTTNPNRSRSPRRRSIRRLV